MLDAAKVTLSVFLEASLLSLAVYFYLDEIGEKNTGRFFLVGSILSLAGGFACGFLPFGQNVDLKLWMNKGHLLLSGGFILLSLLALPGLGPHFILGVEKVLAKRKIWLSCFFFLLGMVLLPLEGLRLVFDLKAFVFLKENNLPYLFALVGLFAGIALAFGLFRLSRLIRLGRFFNFSGLLFLIVAIKALWEPAIVSSIEVIIARILHDLVHWVVVFMLMPDHIYLTQNYWNLLAFFFRKDTSLVMNLAFILSLGVFSVVYLLSRQFPEIKEVSRGADRRKIWAGIKKARRRQAFSTLTACAILLVVGYNAFGAGKGLYEPTPKPLSVNAQGFAEAPVSKVSDGLIHVYSHTYKEKSIRFIVIKKPDGSFAVALDCCLICPPTTPIGYAQMGRDLFCIYCGTPIPIDTVGKPGGCNPIPIPFKLIKASKLRFDVRRAASVWEQANKGK